MAKYNNLTELVEAFKSGELDKSYFLSIDKGGCDLTLMRASSEDRSDEEINADYKRCQELFKWSYGDPLIELFRLVGIPAEWC